MKRKSGVWEEDPSRGSKNFLVFLFVCFELYLFFLYNNKPLFGKTGKAMLQGRKLECITASNSKHSILVFICDIIRRVIKHEAWNWFFSCPLSCSMKQCSSTWALFRHRKDIFVRFHCKIILFRSAGRPYFWCKARRGHYTYLKVPKHAASTKKADCAIIK